MIVNKVIVKNFIVQNIFEMLGCFKLTIYANMLYLQIDFYDSQQYNENFKKCNRYISSHTNLNLWRITCIALSASSPKFPCISAPSVNIFGTIKIFCGVAWSISSVACFPVY